MLVERRDDSLGSMLRSAGGGGGGGAGGGGGNLGMAAAQNLNVIGWVAWEFDGSQRGCLPCIRRDLGEEQGPGWGEGGAGGDVVFGLCSPWPNFALAQLA